MRYVTLAVIFAVTVLLQRVALADELLVTPEDIAAEVGQKTVHYGTALRLKNVASGFHLHSHEVKYGTGSGQQSVTGMADNHDSNSLWTIKEGQGSEPRLYTQPVRCGDIIRLEHCLTRRNLHSHEDRSPVSGRNEVSAYGEDGDGDEGDNWELVCESQPKGELVKGNMSFHLLHVLTRRYLFTSRDLDFNARNCGRNCPIGGQLEVSGDRDKSGRTRWQITSGVFYIPKASSSSDEESSSSRDSHPDDEL
eukprot:TRINITY_DN3890_c0_g2_i1.p1 TRINITY_DN3890_c0_g2~~TRINITY_DN3890_c0_g2_i1.p1  ORF type:complete len:251 (-),score=51.06 TRINITY_DN3890_c0_g2_i1:155-907(-)